MKWAILKDKEVVIVNDPKEWSRSFESLNRIIAKDEFGGVTVSTVFLGLNHGSPQHPQWFETMIFGGPSNGFQRRYQSYDEALDGHKWTKIIAFSNVRRANRGLK